MKRIILFIALCLPLMAIAGTTPAKDKEATRISLYIPGIFIKAGSLFVDKKEDAEIRQTLAHLRSVSICVRESDAGYSAAAGKKMQRRFSKLQDEKYSPLLTVLDGKEKVAIHLRENKKGTIRQVVLCCDDGESTQVFLKVRCRFTQEMLREFLSGVSKRSDAFASLRNVSHSE